MKMTVGQAAALCGVSVRTLRYYDQIGLLPPAGVSDAGYRYYDGKALARLQQILFYRQLGFELKEIGRIFRDPTYNAAKALQDQRQLLLYKRQQLDEALRLVDTALKGETPTMPKTTLKDIQAAERQYAQEARQRWGGTAAWQESEQRYAAATDQQKAQAAQAMDDIFAGFAACRAQGPESQAAQALVARWQQHITAHYYACTPQILAGLAQMYVQDERFAQTLDSFGPGTAQLMHDAILHYCKGQG